jgi:hypothetical protein
MNPELVMRNPAPTWSSWQILKVKRFPTDWEVQSDLEGKTPCVFIFATFGRNRLLARTLLRKLR